jgi:hypothetical protein
MILKIVKLYQKLCSQYLKSKKSCVSNIKFTFFVSLTSAPDTS